MRIDVVTLFPGMFEPILGEGLVARAVRAGIVAVRAWQLRDFADDRHRTVDDAPFGGGPGMVLKVETLARALDALPRPDRTVVLLSASGSPLTQARLRGYADRPHLAVVCGRYEGVDDRIRALYGAEEVSLGDFVLAGGEIAALALIEGVVRLLPGAVGDPGSLAEESFAPGAGLLEYPQYTRPPEFRGIRVPDVLLSGDHAKVARWRRWMALRRTAQVRPDLIAGHPPSEEDRRLMESPVFEEE